MTKPLTQAIAEMQIDNETPPSPELETLDELMEQYASLEEEYRRFDEESYDSDEPSWNPNYIYHRGGDGNSFRLGSEKERTEAITACAHMGLELYNEQNKTDYYFDRYVDLNFYVEDTGVYCYHCNFMAKPKTVPRLPTDEGDYIKKLFFAEICVTVRTSFATCCSMLYGEEKRVGCGICPGLVYHPASGFTRGSNSDKSDNPSPISTDLALSVKSSPNRTDSPFSC